MTVTDTPSGLGAEQRTGDTPSSTSQGTLTTDIVVVGAGLAGLVAAAEAADAGRPVIVLDQEPAAALGGQAYWSLGGLFLVDTPGAAAARHPGQRRARAVGLDGNRRLRPARGPLATAWAEAFVALRGRRDARLDQGSRASRLFPVVQWAERGGYQGSAHGNSVPRFHVAWGTGPGVVTPILRRVMAHVRTGRIQLRFRHRVTELVSDVRHRDRRDRRGAGAVVGRSR